MNNAQSLDKSMATPASSKEVEKLISTHESTSAGKHTPGWGIVLGGLTSGLMDLVYASAGKASQGGSVFAPWKSVASGLLGPAAREGGVGIALFGIALHFMITFGAAVILSVILRWLPWFAKRPLITGVLFGFGFLLVMNYVILPLSAIGQPLYVGRGFLTAILGHVIMIGLPIAWFVTRGSRVGKTEAR